MFELKIALRVDAPHGATGCRVEIEYSSRSSEPRDGDSPVELGQLASGVTELDGGLTLVLPDKKALGPKGRVTVRAPAGTILLQQPLDMTRLDEVLTLDIPTIPVPALRLPMVDYEEI